MAPAPVYVGLDIATAETRAIAVDAHGKVLAHARAPLAAPHRQGPYTSQPATYAAVALRVLAELTACLDGREIDAISVGATSGTVVACDAHGRPVADAILYDDQRFDAEDPEAAQRIRDTAAHPPAGHPPAAVDALLRLAWLERNVPAAAYRHVSDVVLSALAGHDVPADTSHALKTGADVIDRRWPSGLLGAAGVDAAKLPGLRPPATVVAALSAQAAASAGIAGRPRLVLGMTDGCCGQIATGAVAAGAASSVLGTTLVVKVGTSDWTSVAGGGYAHLSPDGVWWRGGASNVGGGVLRAEFADRPLAAWDAEAAARGPAGTVRFPLPGRGERFPLGRGDATGWTLGEPGDPVEAYRATLEGVAFVERLCLETIGGPLPAGDALRSTGGGTASALWRTIRATVLDRPLVMPACPDSAFGAAVLAAAGTGHGSLHAAVAAMVRTGAPTDPDPAQRDTLQESYHSFLAELRRRGWL